MCGAYESNDHFQLGWCAHACSAHYRCKEALSQTFQIKYHSTYIIEQYNIHSQIYNYTESKMLKIHHVNPMMIDHASLITMIK